MSKKKYPRCQRCGDLLPQVEKHRGAALCGECLLGPALAPRHYRPRTLMTCATCGDRYILSDGESEAYHDNRHCLRCLPFHRDAYIPPRGLRPDVDQETFLELVEVGQYFPFIGGVR